MTDNDNCDADQSEINDQTLSGNEIEKTFKLLKDGETHIKLCDQKDVVLLVGTTGTGKSTLTQYIAGEELISVEIGENTGQFTITDGDQRISTTNTIISKTIFPELIVDSKTNVAYYDCPGFSDTRSTAYDIGATYFIKKVIDHIKSVKICFVVAYHSCRTGTDRRSFMISITHVVTFLKNIDKYRDSISLIVTKVDNSFVKRGKGYDLVPDNKVINNIAEFLNEVIGALRDRLEEVDISIKDRKLFEDAIKLVNILLEKKDDDYSRIAIFGRPDEPGPLSQIEMIFEDKERIEKVLYENTVYVEKDDNDFGYTISDKSKADIFDLGEQINQKFTSSVVLVKDEIINYYRNKLALSDNIYKLQEELRRGQDILSKMITNISGSTSSKSFIKQLLFVVKELEIKIGNSVLSDILHQDKYLRFLQDLSDVELKGRPIEWATPLKDALDYINNLNNWYKFLTSLYKKLSSYEIQVDKSKFITSLGLSEQDICINDNNFQPFLENLKEYDIDSIHEFVGKQVDDFQINELNYILTKTLKSKITKHCQNGTLTIRGDYITMREVLSEYPQDIKLLQIFALNTIFIGTDFEKIGEELNLFIIAPKWEIIDVRKIVLDGAQGKSHSQPYAEGGQYGSDSGHNGLPGLPGGLSGNFLGIGIEFKNGHKLTISANGGKGGTGQNGGDGSEGHRGDDAEMWKLNPEDTVWAPNFERNCESGGYTCECYKKAKGGFFQQHVDFWWYYVYGKLGTQGGRGGDGGRGGIGGNAGIVELIQLNKDSQIKVFNDKGEDGDGGNGGSGGNGGLQGNGMDIEWKNSYYYKVLDKLIGTERVQRGYSGSANCNSSGIQSAQEAKFEKIFITINEYKNYARENLKDIYKPIPVIEFLNKMELSEKVSRIYDIFAFINEFDGLENQLHQFNNVTIKHDYFYRSLIARISDYAKHPKNDSLQYRKALNYLYLAAFSKLCNIQNTSQPSLIIDIDSYLDLIIENINTLQEKSKESAQCININKYRNNYKNKLDEKIAEAREFIDKQISSEIDSIGDQIDEKIIILINETIELQKRAHVEKILLIQKKKQLEKQLLMRGILGVFKLVGTFASFLGPKGAAVGAGIGVGTSVTESLVLGQESIQAGQLTLPEGIKNSIEVAENSFINRREKKIDYLNEQIDLISQDIKECPDKFEDTKLKIEDIKERLNAAKNEDTFDIRKVGALEDELKGELKKKNLEFQKEKQTAQLIKAKSVIDKFEKAGKVADVSIDIYNKFKQNQNEIDQISDQIKQAEQKIENLKNYETKIYNTMIPILDGMKNSVDDLEGQLGSKSQVALDVSKWQVQSTIKDIKLQMQQFTKGFQVEENLARCIEKLDEAMSTLIILYDRIQDCYQQEQLADYIANINSPFSLTINIEDEGLMNAINNLEIKIKSNILLGQFAMAKKAFAQWVFPFANLYLQQFNLPAHLELDNNFENLVSNAINQLEVIRTKVKEYNQTIIKGHDTHLIIKEFRSDANSSQPFYVWRNKQFKNAISNLLSGVQIQLFADVRESSIKNAVKFNLVEMRLISDDKTIENEIKDHLKNYKVELTHHGNSYYKFNHKFFVIPGDSQTIIYSFERADDGSPLSKNMVYNKINNGDIMLSPYTMWSIQLIDINDVGFSNLQEYKDYVNLELVGKGMFVDNSFNNIDLMLKDYYLVDDTIAEIRDNNNINEQNLKELIDEYL